MYMLNTILVVSSILAGLFTLLSSLLAYLRIRHTKNRNLYYVFFNWLFFGMSWFFIAAGHYFYNEDVFKVAYVFQIIGTYFLLIFTDYTTRITINPYKLVVLTVVSTLYFYFVFQSNRTEIIPGYGVHFIRETRALQIFLAIFYNYLSFEWILKIWKNAPPNLKKKKAKYFLWAGILMNIIPVIMYFFASFYVPLGAFPFLVHAIGVLFAVIVVRSEPKLLNILPFRAHRILVISRNSGLLLYQHAWTKKKFGHELLSSLIHAVSRMGENVLFSGDLDEFRLQKGTIIFSHTENYSIALIANQPSNHLKASLDGFAEEFLVRYNQLDLDEENGIVLDDFDFVEDLLKNHFESIPSWIEQ